MTEGLSRWEVLQSRLEALSVPELRFLTMYFVRCGTVPLTDMELALQWAIEMHDDGPEELFDPGDDDPEEA